MDKWVKKLPHLAGMKYYAALKKEQNHAIFWL